MKHKQAFIKKLRKYFNANFPELAVSITNIHLNKAVIFATGFDRALNMLVEPPVRQEEYDETVFAESAKFVIGLLEDEK